MTDATPEQNEPLVRPVSGFTIEVRAEGKVIHADGTED